MMSSPPAIVCTAPASAVDLGRMAWALRQVEEVPGKLLGAHGELGPYQFKQKTWESVTGLPFSYAAYPSFAELVARAYLADLRRELHLAGQDVTVYNLALTWKCGPDAVILKKWQSSADKDFAQRVVNLYLDR